MNATDENSYHIKTNLGWNSGTFMEYLYNVSRLATNYTSRWYVVSQGQVLTYILNCLDFIFPIPVNLGSYIFMQNL